MAITANPATGKVRMQEPHARLPYGAKIKGVTQIQLSWPCRTDLLRLGLEDWIGSGAAGT